MNIRKRHLILIVIFLTLAITRSLLSAQSSNFSDDHSYYVMRQIEHVSENLRPIHEDTLSFGGREFIIMPFYYYLMGLLYRIVPSVLFLKIINNVLASSLVFAVYLLSAKILKNRNIALLCSTVAASLPIYVNETINKLNPYSLITPLAFFILWLFLELDSKNLDYLIPLTLVFILSSTSSLILVIGLIAYILYIYLEKKKIEKLHVEYVSFFLLFFLWVSFILFKEAFQSHGFSILVQKVTITAEIFNQLGVVLILLSLYSVYLYTSRKKSVYMTLFIVLAVSNIVLLTAGLVPYNTVIFLGVYMVVLMGQAVRDFNIYLTKTKIEKYSKTIIAFLFFAIILTQAIPVFFLYERSFPDRYIEGFRWIRDNTEPDATILSVPEEGHLITYVSKRRNVLDTETLLVDYEERYEKVLNMYTQVFKTNIFEVLDEYGADYIILSDKLSRHNIRIQNTVFFQDSCFDLVYNEEIKVFERCEK